MKKRVFLKMIDTKNTKHKQINNSTNKTTSTPERGPRKFFQRVSNFDNVLFFVFLS